MSNAENTNTDWHTASAELLARAAPKRPTIKSELWMLLAMFLIAFALSFLLDSQRMVLGFYTLPTLYSAYRFGRRHATLTAIGSVCIVGLLTFFNPRIFDWQAMANDDWKWFDMTVWGGILVITAYAMGTLHERQQSTLEELRESYHGILLILQHIASNDKYSQDHAYRVSICATKIAERMDLSSDQVEDVRAAALLHDIDKLGISREVLCKSANLTQQEFDEAGWQMSCGKVAAQPIGGSLRRVIPILLAYQTAYKDNGEPGCSDNLPTEARIIAVADAYETLTSSAKSRVAPGDAMSAIVQRAGKELDESVVQAFVSAYQHGRAPVGAK